MLHYLSLIWCRVVCLSIYIKRYILDPTYVIWWVQHLYYQAQPADQHIFYLSIYLSIYLTWSHICCMVGPTSVLPRTASWPAYILSIYLSIYITWSHICCMVGPTSVLPSTASWPAYILSIYLSIYLSISLSIYLSILKGAYLIPHMLYGGSNICIAKHSQLTSIYSIYLSIYLSYLIPHMLYSGSNICITKHSQLTSIYSICPIFTWNKYIEYIYVCDLLQWSH